MQVSVLKLRNTEKSKKIWTPENIAVMILKFVQCGFTPTEMHPKDAYEPRHDKTCLREFPTRPDTNRPAQPQKLASLEILAKESRDIILSKQRTTKALIRLRGCAGWSAPLLFAYNIRHILSCRGSYGMANSEDTESNLGLHSLPRPVCTKT